MRIAWPRWARGQPALWTALALGVPALVAVVVIAWGTYATNVSTSPLDPSAVPLTAYNARGEIVRIAPTLTPATPTPGLQVNTVRVQGVVVDELGLPLDGVCIPIGPNGCREHSPRTDTRGVWWFDFPKSDVDYDLHFQKDGYREVVRRIKPTAGDVVLNIVLGR